ncbi:hypothetical protein [Microbacterium oleivorans]|uniref:Uncharacterized protein n=1 Tax=Microbacterium oleivorans TaxID=273677 RepID=A0A7D5F855_9MICO|nr:hypothetical protein [Microbacterium oleivorans]QLD11369.1 hypothetical protein HW566_06025 [Microbacterium oleivorans]
MPEQNIDREGEPITVAPGLRVFPVVRGRWRLGPDTVSALAEGQVIEANVSIEYSANAGRYRLTALDLRAPLDGPEITGALLRTVRVQEVVRATALSAMEPAERMVRSDAVDALSAAREASPISDFAVPDAVSLLNIAMLYRSAEIASDNPGQAVAEFFGMQRRTAANWIARARRAGYFDHVVSEAELASLVRRVVQAARDATAPRERPQDGDG